jgi:tetratricopeptide (TPR) repeat protein
MPPSAKSIREDLARAKAAYAKNDDLRTLQLTLSALRAFVTVRPSGPDRTMVEGLFRECFANLAKLERIKKHLPHGLPYVKGQEKQLHDHLVPLARIIQEEINREGLEAMRERKLRIDQAIIKGTKLLGEGNILEAQRNFRSAVDEYVDEKGLFPLIASRLIEAGHFKASIEYVKRAIEESPDNPRAYDFLFAVADKADEWTAAERILQDARRQHGPHALLLQGLARIEAQLGHWQEARETARQALEANPHLEEARKVLSLASSNLEGRAAPA